MSAPKLNVRQIRYRQQDELEDQLGEMALDKEEGRGETLLDLLDPNFDDWAIWEEHLAKQEAIQDPYIDELYWNEDLYNAYDD